MQKDIKFEGANGTKKSAVRHFWAYCAILFSCALILIMLAGYIQTRSLNKLQSENSTQENLINTKDSAIKNIQAMYEDQKAAYDKLKKDYEILLGDTKKTRETLIDTQKEKSQIEEIAAVQTLYIKNQKAQAKKDFMNIKFEEIKNETIKEQYTALRIKLGIKASAVETPQAKETPTKETQTKNK
ncbi:MAG: hypothetical protein RR073_02990 [Clostridia bacterium]